MEPFHRYISNESTLPARDREVLILRIASLSRSVPVWNAHVAAARAAGLTATDISRAGGVPDARGFGDFDGALLRAADELHRQSFLSDASWAALAGRYDRRQMMDARSFCASGTCVGAPMNGRRTHAPAAPQD